MATIPNKTNPKLFDLAILPIQASLMDNLPWLDRAYGVCEKLVEIKERKKYTSANVYLGKGQYELIMPCDEIGNLAFFYLKDPQEMKANGRIKSRFSLILWYDMRKVSLASDERNREQIKSQILGVLNSLHLANVSWEKVYEEPNNVFSDFSYEHTNSQFLMSPYAGLRIEGSISVKMDCFVKEMYHYLLTKEGYKVIDREGKYILVRV